MLLVYRTKYARSTFSRLRYGLPKRCDLARAGHSSDTGAVRFLRACLKTQSRDHNAVTNLRACLILLVLRH
ncbi:hypothetical protein CGSMWGv6119V5_04436 [Gardnerella vaginalis 6119V5]|nr:hypothetical protein CGSMWGv6119V5_04436 [Gardnerella vaginalis 6119V5]